MKGGEFVKAFKAVFGLDDKPKESIDELEKGKGFEKGINFAEPIEEPILRSRALDPIEEPVLRSRASEGNTTNSSQNTTNNINVSNVINGAGDPAAVADEINSGAILAQLNKGAV